MTISKYINDPALIKLVDQIIAGEMTRKDAAETLGISVATFNTRLTRAKMIDRLKPTIRYDGPNQFKPDPVKAAVYEQALAYAKAHPNVKAIRIHEMFPGGSYQNLARKLKAIKEATKEP